MHAEESVDLTVVLAEQAGMDVQRFGAIFGGGWQHAPEWMNHDTAPGDEDDSAGRWAYSGDPCQLALRVCGDEVELGMPVGRWQGCLGGHYEVRDGRRLRLPFLDNADLVVAELLRRRRASFRYCRYCRRLTAPEDRHSADTCFGCAGEWLGIVW